MLCDRVAQALRGDTAHREHQRRGLHAALGIAFAALDAGTEGHVGVARTVDHGAGEDRLAPCLAFDDHPLYFVALPDDVGAENIHQYLDAGLLHQLLCEGLALLRVDDRQAYVEFAGSVSARGAPLLQPVDLPFRVELLRGPVFGERVDRFPVRVRHLFHPQQFFVNEIIQNFCPHTRFAGQKNNLYNGKG